MEGKYKELIKKIENEHIHFLKDIDNLMNQQESEIEILKKNNKNLEVFIFKKNIFYLFIINY